MCAPKIHVKVFTPTLSRHICFGDEGGYRGDQVKMRPLGWVPNSVSGVLMKRGQFGPRDRQAHREDDGKRRGEGGHPQAKERGPEQTLPPQPSEGNSPADGVDWASGPQNRESTISVVEAHCLPPTPPPACGTLLEQSWQTNTARSAIFGLVLTLKNCSYLAKCPVFDLAILWRKQVCCV